MNDRNSIKRAAVAQRIHENMSVFTEEVVSSPNPNTLLSPREMEVLRLLAKGKSRAATGAVLGISTDTVKLHAKMIRQKLGGGHTTIAAVSRAYELGILPG